MNWIEVSLIAISGLAILSEFVLRFNHKRRNRNILYYSKKNLIMQSFSEPPSAKTIFEPQALTNTSQAPVIGWTLKPNFNNSIFTTDQYGFRNKPMSIIPKKNKNCCYFRRFCCSWWNGK